MEISEVERELERHHAAAFGWALACCAWDAVTAEDVLQAAYLEGQWSVNVVNRYLTGGKKVKNGSYYAPANPNKAPAATITPIA